MRAAAVLALWLAASVTWAQAAAPRDDAITAAWRVLQASDDPEIRAVRTLLAERARVQPLARVPGTPATDSRVANLERQVLRLEQQVRELRSELLRVRSRM